MQIVEIDANEEANEANRLERNGNNDDRGSSDGDGGGGKRKRREVGDTETVDADLRNGQNRTSKLWSIGLLHEKLSRIARNARALNGNEKDHVTGEGGGGGEVGRNRGAGGGSGGRDGGGNDGRATNYATDENDDELTPDQRDRLKYMGILDQYLASKRNAKTEDEESGSAVASASTWMKCERQKWQFKIVFFIVYTLTAIANFVLVYNYFNYWSLVLQVVNISVTYSLLLLAL